MSNIKNCEIIEQLLEKIEDMGGDVKGLYEEHDITQITSAKLIELLSDYIEDLENRDDYPIGGSVERYDIEEEKQL